MALDKTAQSSPMTRLYEWAHARIPQVLDCRPIPVRAVLTAAGFRPVDEAEASWWGLATAIVVAVKQ